MAGGSGLAVYKKAEHHVQDSQRSYIVTSSSASLAVCGLATRAAGTLCHPSTVLVWRT
jgi:hypothetical protein